MRNSKLNNTRYSWGAVGQLGHNWCKADIIPQSVQCVCNLGGRKIHCRGAKRRPQTGNSSASQRRQVGQGMSSLALGLEMMPLHALQRREFWHAPSLGTCDGVGFKKSEKNRQQHDERVRQHAQAANAPTLPEISSHNSPRRRSPKFLPSINSIPPGDNCPCKRLHHTRTTTAPSMPQQQVRMSTRHLPCRRPWSTLIAH